MIIDVLALTFFLTPFSDVSICEGSETRLPLRFRTERRLINVQYIAGVICFHAKYLQ